MYFEEDLFEGKKGFEKSFELIPLIEIEAEFGLAVFFAWRTCLRSFLLKEARYCSEGSAKM